MIGSKTAVDECNMHAKCEVGQRDVTCDLLFIQICTEIMKTGPIKLSYAQHSSDRSSVNQHYAIMFFCSYKTHPKSLGWTKIKKIGS